MAPPLAWHAETRAILHIDADAFFASCEQAVNPALKGQPVVIGKERGIASAVSYEAKALGVRRGMTLHEIRQRWPQVLHLPSDYETYSLFSQRLFAIVRRYTSQVEEYSIDECFADLTGLRRPLRLSYPAMASRLKDEMERDLGLTFSVGLAPTKVLAKLASRWRKPSGFTVIPDRQIHTYLEAVPIGEVWGIGPQTTAYLLQFGIRTAGDFCRQQEGWIKARLTAPHHAIWLELRGQAQIPLEVWKKHDYQSISKTKTFTPPSTDRHFILAQLSKNAENACIKARRHQLVTRRVYFFLRTQDFRHTGYEIVLSRPTAVPHDIVPLIDRYLDAVYASHTPYRLTGVVLARLSGQGPAQLDLFTDAVRAERVRRLYEAVDALDRKYGKHTVFLGSSFTALRGQQHAGERAELPRRHATVLKGEGPRKRLGLPLLGEVQ